MLALATTLALIAAPHPSLFFNSTDVAHLRSAAQTTHSQIATNITAGLAAHLNDPAPTPSQYGAGSERSFGMDIAVWAFAYQMTGDTRYAAQAWVRLNAYLSWTDWGFGNDPATQPDLYYAHMVMGVACAYDWLYDYLPAADRAAVETRLATEAQRIATFFPNAWWLADIVQNHNWIDTAALGLAGLVLTGEDFRASSWLSMAQGNLANIQLVTGPISDGSWHEGIAYQVYGVAFALPFWMASARAGVDRTDMGMLRGLGKSFLAATIPDAPRTQILTHGDFTGWPREGIVQILRYSAARYHDGLAEAAAQRWLSGGSRVRDIPQLWYDVFEFIGYDPTVAAADPHGQPLDTQLPDMQASILHSTWDKGDLVLAFKAGPYGGRANFDRLKAGGAPGGIINWGHDHNDDMSFWLYGSGTWLAPEAAGYDAGRRANPPPAGAIWANETQYHNGLLIDGTGELGDVRASASQGGPTNNPWFFQRDAVPFGISSTTNYAVTGASGANLYAPATGLTRWDRTLVLARKRYALVRDDIAATGSHDFDWLCHFPDGATVDTASGWVQGAAHNAMSLGVRVVSPSSWTATTGLQGDGYTYMFEPDAKIGYVKVRPSAPSSAVQFLTALVPVSTAAWASRMQIDPLATADTGAGAIVAPRSALEERWIFSRPAADGKVAGDLALTSSLVGMAAYNLGEPARAFLARAGKISDRLGTRELLSSTTASAIEADINGSSLVVSGSGISDFRAYAPVATTVTVNGASVAFSRDGSVVVYPAVGAPPPPPPPPLPHRTREPPPTPVRLRTQERRTPALLTPERARARRPMGARVPPSRRRPWALPMAWAAPRRAPACPPGGCSRSPDSPSRELPGASRVAERRERPFPRNRQLLA